MFCISGVRTKGSEAAGAPKKKRKKTQKKSPEQEQKAMDHKTKALGKKPPTSSRPKNPMVSKQEKGLSSLGSPKGKWLQDVHGQGWDGPRHKCPHCSTVLAGVCPVLHDNLVTRHYLFFCVIGTNLIVQLQGMCFKGAWVELLNGGL